MGRARLAALGVTGALVIGGSFGGAALAGAGASGASTTGPSSVSFQFSAFLTPPGGTATTVSGSGQADFASDQAAVTVTLPPGLASHLPGDTSASTTVQAVLANSTVYLSWPGLSGATGGKPWVSFSLPSKPAGAIPGALTAVSSTIGDVSGIVTFAQNHGATVTELGTSTVNGVTATGTQLNWSLSSTKHHGRHHHLTWKRVRQLEHRFFGVRAGTKGTAKLAATSVMATVWADANNDLVQGSIAVTGARGGSLTAQVNLSGYNTPVTITVPSSNDVLNVPFSVVEHYLGQLSKRH